MTDDVKKNDSTNPWDDDAIEIYLDADHNGGTSYDANDRQIACGWGDATPVEGAGRAIAGVTFGKTDPTGTTYVIEAKIPWAVEAFTPSANASIGIDVHVDDDDDGGARDGKLEWNDGTDMAWSNPSLFGTGKLLAGGGSPVQVNLTSSFNIIGIQNDGVVFGGGLDGGNAYSGNLLGTSKTWSGATFTIGPAAANDAVTSTGQAITLPAGHFSSLKLLAAGVLGSQASQSFSVKYTDTTTSPFTQSLSDWCNSQAYAGESIAVPMTYRNQGAGTKQTIGCNVYGYTFALNNAKTTQSITLPNNGNVKVLAITLVP